MSCDDCLSRRAFLTKSGLAVAGVAAIASGCGDGQFGPASLSTTTQSVQIKVASIPALATVGQLVKIPVTSGLIAVKRTGTASFSAISTVCTHQGCEVDIQANAFVCPCHNSRYDNSGGVTRQPDGGGFSTNLPTYVTKYDAATDTLTIGS